MNNALGFGMAPTDAVGAAIPNAGVE